MVIAHIRWWLFPTMNNKIALTVNRCETSTNCRCFFNRKLRFSSRFSGRFSTSFSMFTHPGTIWFPDPGGTRLNSRAHEKSCGPACVWWRLQSAVVKSSEKTIHVVYCNHVLMWLNNVGFSYVVKQYWKWWFQHWFSQWTKFQWVGVDRFTYTFPTTHNYYPLVNVCITMENHHFSWDNSLFQWPFSIANC